MYIMNGVCLRAYVCGVSWGIGGGGGGGHK